MWSSSRMSCNIRERGTSFCFVMKYMSEIILIKHGSANVPKCPKFCMKIKKKMKIKCCFSTIYIRVKWLKLPFTNTKVSLLNDIKECAVKSC